VSYNIAHPSIYLLHRSLSLSSSSSPPRPTLPSRPFSRLPPSPGAQTLLFCCSNIGNGLRILRAYAEKKRININ